MDILQLLNDGKFHSGEELGRALGISRAAVWKQLSQWRERGIQFDSVPGKGYRMLMPHEPFSKQKINDGLSDAARALIADFFVYEKVGSTNDVVMQAMQPDSNRAVICLAEEQTAGRGRRGREWVSLPVSNFYGSLGWRFSSLANVEGLSLAVGVAIIRALKRYGVSCVGLKWPNDIMWQNAKLGGVLIDLQAETDGPATVVIGVGLNLRTVPGLDKQLGRSIAALDQCTKNPLNRNYLATLILEEMLLLISDYADKGFAAYHAEWLGHDVLNGEVVQIEGANKALTGIARGVNTTGALLLETEGGVQQIYAGEVTLRKEPT